jgi:hypothetical protein
MNSTSYFSRSFRTVLVSALGICFLVSASHATQATGAKTTFAQTLVESTHAHHPETTEIGIAARSSRGCETMASTDRGDIGEKCEKDDLTPMQTGNPFVEKEKDGFDVSLPLHDAQGKMVGTVGIEFKSEPGQTESSVLAQAKTIAAEMETHIPSKAKLYERAE